MTVMATTWKRTKAARSWRIGALYHLAVLACLGTGCTKACETKGAASTSSTGWPAPGTRGTFPTVCESSALLWSEGRLLLGDNEAPDVVYEVSQDLATVTPQRVGDVDDIEALAGTASDLWVVGSQSAHKDAEPRPAREHIVHGAQTVRPTFDVCPACETARTLAPKKGGLNVEGAVVFGGRLWLGLRSPTQDGKSILLQMSSDGARAEKMVLVDLGDEGIRDLVAVPEGILVLAGPLDDRPSKHHLWFLDSPEGTPHGLPLLLPPHSEAVAVVDTGLLWVTDGDGKPGKCRTPSTWGVEPMPPLR
jgi:hypothetical protein